MAPDAIAASKRRAWSSFSISFAIANATWYTNAIPAAIKGP